MASFEDVVVSSLPPARLFRAMTLDADRLLPKVVPVPVQKVEILHGDGRAGTVKAIHFTQETNLKGAKQRIDEIDEENLFFKCTVIEGYALEGGIDAISYAVKVEPVATGGSVSRTTVTYHSKIEGFQVPDEKVEQQRAKSQAIVRALESYLDAHPEI